MLLTQGMFRRLMSTAVSENTVKSFESIPGPKSLPIIGGLWKYLPVIGNFELNRLHVTGFRMYQEYGSVVKENLMNGEAIVNVFGPDDIGKVYKSEGKYPARRSHMALEHYRLTRPDLYNTGGLLPTNGPEWWRLRSTFQKSLTKVQDVRLFLPSTNEIVNEFLSTFIGNGILINDFLPTISRLNLELTWAALFGNRLGSFCSDQLNKDSVSEHLIEATETANSCILRTDMTKDIWTKMFKTPTYKRLEQCLIFIGKVVDDQLNKVINTKEGNTIENNEEVHSLLNTYLKFQEVDLKDIRAMAEDLILGGIDTTSYTACFLIYHLANNKNVQKILKEEALKLLPNIDSPVTSSVLNDAIYARAILKETFRLNPVATGISRNLDKDTVLSGYLVPKGTLVITQNLVACRLEKNFTDAENFLPERWIRGSEVNYNVSPYLVLPFSHGTRTCIARRLAEQNLLTFLLKVGRNYSLDWMGRKLGIVTPLICKPDSYVSVAFERW